MIAGVNGAGKSTLYQTNSGLQGMPRVNTDEILREFGEAGYLIEIHYVGVDSVEIAKERVKHRVLRGGHGIDESDIERRYYESFKQMNKILKECDLVAFYDNTEAVRRFAIFQRGKLRILSRNIPKWFEEYIEY